MENAQEGSGSGVKLGNECFWVWVISIGVDNCK